MAAASCSRAGLLQRALSLELRQRHAQLLGVLTSAGCRLNSKGVDSAFLSSTEIAAAASIISFSHLPTIIISCSGSCYCAVGELAVDRHAAFWRETVVW